MKDHYKRWLWSKTGEQCVRNLKKRDFDAIYAENREEASRLVMNMTAAYKTVGFGGSDTVRTLGLVELIRQTGKIIYDHWQENLSKETELEIRLQQGRCDCFICSANAISMNGEIVNEDGIGNRTNAMTFGCKKVIIIAGINKVVPDLESAHRRIKEVAAPMRAKSLKMKTPCAETGVCSNCLAPQRICRVTLILHQRPLLSDISVILVNESLGF